MDFGRVNVLIEGARQNFQRTGHNADGVFYIEPEMLKSVDITRGPTATIYGSGAIGGVVAFNLLDADDILRAGETAAIRIRKRYSSNGDGILTSETGAVKVGNFDILGQINWRSNGNYVDGSGTEVQDSGSDTGSSLVKARWRPAPGHQITGTIIDYNSDFINTVGTARRDTDVQNEQYTLGYTSPVRMCLWSISARRSTGTTPISPKSARQGGGPFDIETEGFDINNTTRFKFGNTKVALTYGGDGFKDTVESADSTYLRRNSHRAASELSRAHLSRARSLSSTRSISSRRCVTTPTNFRRQSGRQRVPKGAGSRPKSLSGTRHSKASLSSARMPKVTGLRPSRRR